jgi:hypothetical protein
MCIPENTGNQANCNGTALAKPPLIPRVKSITPHQPISPPTMPASTCCRKRQHEVTLEYGNNDDAEYLVRKNHLKQKYYIGLEVVRKTLIQSTTKGFVDKAAEIKTDRFLENISRIVRLLEESPQAGKAREMSSLDRVERFLETNVIPVFKTIAVLHRKRACATKSLSGASEHADLEPPKAFWSELTCS